ncbi:dynein regulatory complex subunit 2 [Pagrus major]|uniref:dynein regulatory complex subunit 2 n=1 Tax=Pagrus major TaxID=143350 RepID=UPI003CC84B95
MPKKAKKGGGKGGGKTEEERLLYLRQRAQAEEEMAKQKEEILTQFLKDKLQREQRNTAVNLLKLNEGWRSILRQTRTAELREDIAVLSQTFERRLDALDSVLRNLESDLQEAERQSAQVRRVHLQHLERLRAQQDKRLTFVQLQWENGLQHLSSMFSSERKQTQASRRQQRADLEDAMFSLEQQHKVVMEEIHRLYADSITAFESAHDDRVAALVQENKNKLEERSLQNQELVKLCSDETKKVDDLLANNQRLIQKTNADMRNVKSLQDLVIQLRERLNSRKTKNQLVEQDLTAARDQVKRKTLELREQLTRSQKAARKQLTDLSLQGHSATKRLEAVTTKGERVLHVAEMCQKLENKQRNVSALFSAEDHRTETQQPAEGASAFPELQRVTRSINSAVLQREALKKHKQDLTRENQQLRLLLRQHLDGMTVSDGTLDGPNALLAVTQAPTTTAPLDTNRRHTVIEGVHAVKHSL